MPQPEPQRSAHEPETGDLSPLRTPGVSGVWSIVDVTTRAGCQAVADLCRETAQISIDTETYGWLPDKGLGPSPETVGELALLQIGFPDTRRAFLIDIVALKASGTDWRPVLGPVIESPAPEKIVHFGLFERAVFQRCGLTFEAGVVDTCAVAKALWQELRALHPDLNGKSLKALSYHLLGRDISKAEQASDWQARPLTPEQRSYAALDVELAADLFRALEGVARLTGLDPRAVEWRAQPSHRAG